MTEPNAQPPSESPVPPRRARPRYTFGRSQRIKNRLRIDALFKTGKRRTHHPLLVCALRREDNDPARVAISIGRSCGNAVVRNTIKRKIREAYRLLQHELPPGMDYLLVVRPHAVMPMQAYQDRLRHVLR